MNLRQRTLLSVAATLAVLMLGVYLLSSSILMRSYENLERRETTRNVQRVSDELAFQLQQMHQNATDWSNWDDTYKFLSDKNKPYIDSNLNNVQLDLDIMLFLDTKGSIFYSYPIPRKDHAPPPKAEDLVAGLGFGKPGTMPAANKDFSGIVRMANGDSVMVSVHPIVKTSGAGPPRGWTVFGLRFDTNEISRLAMRTHLAVDLFDLSQVGRIGLSSAAVTKLMAGERCEIKPLSDQTIAGYQLLKDVHGKPIGILRLTDRRDIYAEGLNSQKNLLQFITVSGLVFSIVILWVLEVAALSRVWRLRLQVEHIGSDEDDETRVSLPGRDELSWLARVIDGMIQSLRKSKRELREKNEDLTNTVQSLAATNHILANAVEGIAQFDDADCIVNLNAAFAAMHGYEVNELDHFHWQTLVSPEDHERVSRAIDQMMKSGKGHCEARGRRADGSLFHEEIVIVAALDAERHLASSHWFTKDISERKELESRIEFQAFHDPLTGLPNRSLFMDRLTMACSRSGRRNESIAVLFIDLDGFKLINDSMGHESGDHLLASVAKRVQRCVRPQDTVARLGGDEFTVLIDGLGVEEEAIEVAERILTALDSPISLPNGKAFASASIGIVFATNGEMDADSLLHAADIAMYQAKQASDARYAVFEQEMYAPAMERRELADLLQEALDGNQLSLHYQPLIDLTSGKANGVEALLRWRHAERGDIPPSLFVSVAEESGMMDSLGTWALRKACFQMREWLDKVPECASIAISVNVSGKQLQRNDFLETVLAALTDSNLPPECLRIEVGAKTLSGDTERMLQTLTAIKELGVRLAIDDFGTGSHLISKLGDLPFDMVKIDGSLTWLLESHVEVRALVQAVLIMANSVHVQVAAEGVETQSQLKQLRDLGCTVAQGFIFGRPLPAEQLIEALVQGVAMSLFADKSATDQAA